MPLRNDIKNNFLKLITGQVAEMKGTGQCYLGLSSTAPDENGGNFTEPEFGDGIGTEASYGRVQMSIAEAIEWTNKWGTPAVGKVTNSEEVTTPECKVTDGWPTFTHFGIFDCAQGGTPVAWDLLTDPDGEPDEDGRYPAKPLTVAQNQVAVFRKGTLMLDLK